MEGYNSTKIVKEGYTNPYDTMLLKLVGPICLAGPYFSTVNYVCKKSTEETSNIRKFGEVGLAIGGVTIAICAYIYLTIWDVNTMYTPHIKCIKHF